MALIQNSFSTSTLSFHEGNEEEEKEARSSVVFLTSAKIDCSVDTRHSVAYRNRNQTQINSSSDAALGCCCSCSCSLVVLFLVCRSTIKYQEVRDYTVVAEG